MHDTGKTEATTTTTGERERGVGVSASPTRQTIRLELALDPGSLPAAWTVEEIKRKVGEAISGAGFDARELPPLMIAEGENAPRFATDDEARAYALGRAVEIARHDTERAVGHMLRPLDVIETRTLTKLVADGDQNGARVIVTSDRRPELEGKVGTVRALPVFGYPSGKPLGTTRVRLELEGARGGCELVELEGEELDDVVGVSRVRCKADGRHGIAWQDRHGLLFLPEGRAYRDALPVSRSDIEAAGDFDAELVSSIRVEEGVVHDRVHVWNRGGKAGELVVRMGDGQSLALALTEILAGRMCAGRAAAAKALREAGDDFDKAQERLVCVADDLEAAHKGTGIQDAPSIARDSAKVLRDLIVTLGDASCACSVSAKRVEAEIGRPSSHALEVSR